MKKKLKPIHARVQPCLNCPPKPLTLKMNAMCAVGFGMVRVTRNGRKVWMGDDLRVRVMRFEWMARKTPGDWRIEFIAPLYNSLYQRQGRNRWVMVRKGLGFA